MVKNLIPIPGFGCSPGQAIARSGDPDGLLVRQSRARSRW
jgi:hypothetical protein